MIVPFERALDLVAGLTYQDRTRVLVNVLWDVFGDVDDNGALVLDFSRSPDHVDVESLVASLRQEFGYAMPDAASAVRG